MKLLFRRSFAGKVSAYIIVLILAIFCVIMVLFYRVARSNVVATSVRQASSMLTNMSQQIEAQLQSVSHNIDYSAWVIEANANNDEVVKRLLKQNIENNPMIIGGSLAFTPDTINGQERLKMIYAYKNDTTVTFNLIGDKEYYYPQMEWFKTPQDIKTGYWSEPYFDKGAGNIIMATYSRPLIDSTGKVFAVYTADISLLSFTDVVEKIQPFPESYTFMISRKGYYITHRKKERILHETVFTRAKADGNSDYIRIGNAMIKGESGSYLFENDNELSYAIYTPVSNLGWSICNVGKQDVLLADLNSVTRSIIIIFILGVFLFFLCTLFIIKRLMRPLEGFASSAKEIAHGNFKANLPNIKSEDEMKELHDSFVYMQHSLTQYMAELKESTASKERIESELNIAHNIQMGMLPRIFPPFPERADVELYATLKPAKEVGGDLYDFFIMDEKLYFAIGDVSGKGVPASLFMAVTRTLFRNIARSAITSAELVTQMNQSIAEQNESNMFVTMFVGILDLQTGNLDYCNAGHNPPLFIVPNGEVTLLKPKINQLVVGVFSETEYHAEQLTLKSGTKLFCYTDGVVEAESIKKDLYNEDRLLQIVSAHYQEDVKRITDEVLKSVAQHASGAEQSDDITILAINYKK